MNLTAPHTDIQTIELAIAAVLMPLLAFLLNFFVFHKTRIAAWVSFLSIFTSLALAVIVFKHIWNQPQQHVQQLWFTIGATRLYAGILLNNLSVLLLLLVTLIATPVHIYSISYMAKDDRYERYFTWLSFFCFAMLGLVVVDSMILFYAFWELVGFASYILIGFWYTRESAVKANKKAFIMNRIGDIGLLSGIMILFANYHTFDIDALFGNSGLIRNSTQQISAGWQFVAFIGIFLAVAAKSAQFPLHTWLPDAMEGPTSVSALIHAATMVAAGVFLLGRVYPMFTGTERDILAIVGCFTAVMAASTALTQNDLKRILAYSTISQLGFMVMAMGIGAYSSALFHLFTHAFFKCLLFLVAGLVIHQMHHVTEESEMHVDCQNILHMGGLRKKMPFTFIVAVVAALALIGLPFTSGYLSKDGILIQAFGWTQGRSSWFLLVPIGAVLASWMTAFYITRLIVKVFFGDFRLLEFEPKLKLHFHDGNLLTKLPMAFLAICCVFVFFSFNPFLYEDAWVYNGFNIAGHLLRMDFYNTLIPIGVNILSVFLIYGAYAMYIKQKVWIPQNEFLFKLSYHQWYFNDIYNAIIVKPVMKLADSLYWFDSHIIDGFINLLENIGLLAARISAWLDRNIVDGFLHLLAGIVMGVSNFVRRFQGGKVQYYLLSMLALLLLVFIIKILI